jgi:hypothetical protein
VGCAGGLARQAQVADPVFRSEEATEAAVVVIERRQAALGTADPARSMSRCCQHCPPFAGVQLRSRAREGRPWCARRHPLYEPAIVPFVLINDRGVCPHQEFHASTVPVPTCRGEQQQQGGVSHTGIAGRPRPRALIPGPQNKKGGIMTLLCGISGILNQNMADRWASRREKRCWLGLGLRSQRIVSLRDRGTAACWSPAVARGGLGRGQSQARGPHRDRPRARLYAPKADHR